MKIYIVKYYDSWDGDSEYTTHLTELGAYRQFIRWMLNHVTQDQLDSSFEAKDLELFVYQLKTVDEQNLKTLKEWELFLQEVHWDCGSYFEVLESTLQP